MAGGRGFEPLLTESESVVLPLDEPPIFCFFFSSKRNGFMTNLQFYNSYESSTGRGLYLCPCPTLTSDFLSSATSWPLLLCNNVQNLFPTVLCRTPKHLFFSFLRKEMVF